MASTLRTTLLCAILPHTFALYNLVLYQLLNGHLAENNGETEEHSAKSLVERRVSIKEAYSMILSYICV